MDEETITIPLREWEKLQEELRMLRKPCFQRRQGSVLLEKRQPRNELHPKKHAPNLSVNSSHTRPDQEKQQSRIENLTEKING